MRRVSAAMIRSRSAAAGRCRGHPLIWAVIGQRLYLFLQRADARVFPRGSRAGSSIRPSANGRTLPARSENDSQQPILPPHAALPGVSPGNEGRNAKIFGGAAIGQREALRGSHDAAGGDDQRMPGRHIPFAGRCETRIDIRGAFRDLTKLDGRAAGGPRESGRARSRKASVAASKCERLTAATGPVAAKRRVRIG